MRRSVLILMSFLLIFSPIAGAFPVVSYANEINYTVNDTFEGPDWTEAPTTSQSEQIGSYIAEVYSNKGTAWVFNPEENYTQVTTDPLNENNKAIKLIDNQDGSPDKGGATRLIGNSFAPQGTDQTVVVEYDFMGEELGSGIRFRLMNQGGNSALVSLETSGSSLVYRTAEGTVPLIDSLQPNAWYHVKITADMQAGKYDVAVSGSTTAELVGQDFYQPVTDLGRIDINTGNSSTTNLYLDNIQIYQIASTPIEEGTTEETGTEEPVTEEPVTEETSTEEPVTEEGTTEEPSTNEADTTETVPEDSIIYDTFEGSDWPGTPTTSQSEQIGSYIAEVYSNKGTAWIFNPEANYTQVVDEPSQTGNKVIKLVDNQDGSPDQGGATRLINNSFPAQATDKVVIAEYDFMGEEIGSGIRFRLMNKGGNNALASLETSGSSLVYRTTEGTVPLVESLQPNEWYHVKVIADMRTSKYDVVISGGATAELRDQDFYQEITDFGRIDVNTGNSSTSNLYMDNILIYNPDMPPAAPAPITTVAGDQEVKLSWNTVSDASSYNIKRSESPEGPFETIAEKVTDFHYTDSGLTNGTTYYYVVSAVNSIGEGMDSEVVEANPVPGAELPEKPEEYIVHDNFEGSEWPAGPTTEKAAAIGDYTVEVSSNKGAAWVYNAEENFAQVVDAPLFAGNKVLKLHDSQDGSADKGGSTRVYHKNFPAQSNDKTIVAEFDFLAESIGSGSRFRLVNEGGNSTMVSLETSGDNLVLRRADESTVNLIEGIQTNTWYHFKITADMLLEKYDVAVSGGTNTVMRAQPFYQSVSDFGRLDINTGNSSTSTFYVDEITLYNPSIVPAVPSGLTATEGNTQIKLVWNPSSGATSYNVKRSTSAEGPFTTIEENLTELEFNDIGLENGTTYYYVVSGVNSVGEGVNSTPVNVTPSADIPLPAAPSVEGKVRNASATISWESVPDADSYTVKRSSSEEGPYEVIVTGLSSTSYLDTGLTNGTVYYYTVQASGVGGDGPDSDPISLTIAAPLAQPAEVAAQPADGTVALTWSAVEGATSYTIKRSTVNGGPYEAIAMDIEGTTYTDETASNGTTYFYVIAASNGNIQSLDSSQVNATPSTVVEGAPAVPTDFAAEAQQGEVTLSWGEVTDAAGYIVKRSTEADGPFETIATDLETASYSDKEVTNGVQYYYVVQAVNSNGESRVSNVISAIPAPVIVVAKDGSGDYETIQGALDSIPADNSSRKVIFIKNGTYKEKVFVTQPYISFIGESRENTIIEWDDYGGTDGQSGNVGSTFKSQTVDVTGDFFTASSLTVLNSRAPRSEYGTAVALSVKSDQSIFTNVNILGHQDTLYAGSGRQYYHNAYIEGDVDFIFGEAPAVVFENSEIHSVGQNGYITAAAQREEEDKGFVFINSKLTKADSVTKVYLGRPWKYFADTTFINTWMDSHIVPAGWSEWSGRDNHEVANYAEYNSSGPGANPEERTAWSKQLTAAEASALTVPRIFDGWDPTTVTAIPSYTEEKAEPVVSEAYGKALYYFNNKSYYNAVYFAGQAISEGDTRTEVQNLMDKAAQALLKAAPGMEVRKAERTYELLTGTVGVPAAVKEVAESKLNPEVTSPKYNTALWYFNNESYYNAVYFAGQAISEGDTRFELDALMNEAAQALLDRAPEMTAHMEQKSYNLLADTTGVPAAIKEVAESKINTEVTSPKYNTALWYFNNESYYNAVYFAGQAISEGDTRTELQNLMDKAAAALLKAAPGMELAKAERTYELLTGTAGVPDAIKEVAESKLNPEVTSPKYNTALWYFNNESYYNAVYFAGQAISEGDTRFELDAFMNKAAQALLDRAPEMTASMEKRSYELLIKTAGVPEKIKTAAEELLNN